MQWSRNFLPERKIYHEAKPQHSSYASLWTTCSHDQCLILCFFFGYVNKQLKSTRLSVLSFQFDCLPVDGIGEAMEKYWGENPKKPPTPGMAFHLH